MICLPADHHPGDVRRDRQLATREQHRSKPCHDARFGEVGSAPPPVAIAAGTHTALMCVVVGMRRSSKSMRCASMAIRPAWSHMRAGVTSSSARRGDDGQRVDQVPIGEREIALTESWSAAPLSELRRDLTEAVDARVQQSWVGTHDSLPSNVAARPAPVRRSAWGDLRRDSGAIDSSDLPTS